VSKDGKLGKCVCIDRHELLLAPIRIKVFPPTTLAATVRDSASGKPLGGIEVALVLFQGNTSAGSSRQTTDASGRIVFDEVYSGAMYELEVNTKSYNSFRTPWPPPAVGSKGWKRVQEIKLTKADMAKGCVIDEQGKPVAGAEVEQVSWEKTHATTDAYGSFEIGMPAEDNLAWDESLNKPVAMLKVIQGGRDIGAVATINRAELLAKGITITVHPARTLTVTVKDTEGKPLKGVGIEAFLEFGQGGEGASMMLNTSDAGEAVIPSVYCGGTYSFMTKLAGYYRPISGKTGPVGGEKWKDRVEFTMERADRVQHGTVVDDTGAPVSGASVSCSAIDGLKTTTGTSGAFTLTGLPASKVRLYASFGDLQGSAEMSKDTPSVVIKLKARPKK
jgi:hypothetical protein